MRIHLLSLTILLLVFLSGCGKPSDSDTFVDGTDTAEATVVASAPPMKVYRGGR